MAKADMYLRLEGKSTGLIKGESNVADHLDDIEVSGWSWGMSGSQGLAGAGKAGKATLSELRITKKVDRASTALLSVMRNNEQIKKAVLSVRKSGGVPSIDFLTITIERGRISAIDLGNVAPDDPTLVEHLSIAFEKIEVAYAAQDDKGAKKAMSNFVTEIV